MHEGCGGCSSMAKCTITKLKRSVPPSGSCAAKATLSPTHVHTNGVGCGNSHVSPRIRGRQTDAVVTDSTSVCPNAQCSAPGAR